jgi:hypothetical protein
MFGSRPHVHAGFLRSWHASGLHHKILERVQRIAEEGAGSTTRQMTVYITGKFTVNLHMLAPKYHQANWMAINA